MKSIPIFLVMGLFFLCDCTKSKVDPNEVRLQEQWTLLETQATELDKKIRVAGSDPAAKAQLLEDRELLRSRMERMKGKIKLPQAPAGH